MTVTNSGLENSNLLSFSIIVSVLNFNSGSGKRNIVTYKYNQSV